MPVHNVKEEPIPENHDMEEPQRLMEMIPHKIRLSWARDVIQGAKKHGAPKGSKRSRTYSTYVTLMCNLVDAEPIYFEEATKKEWMDAMIEEYQSIIKNDVWDVVPRPREKSVVPSKWIFKKKHLTNESIEKKKERFVAQSFS